MSMEGFPETPEPFTVITGEGEYIGHRRDLFFKEITDFLGYSDRVVDFFVEKKTQTLGIEEPNGFRPSDDRITWLSAQNLAIASVLERRDDFNYVEVLFTHYLTPERIKHLREGLV